MSASFEDIINNDDMSQSKTIICYKKVCSHLSLIVLDHNAGMVDEGCLPFSVYPGYNCELIGETVDLYNSIETFGEFRQNCQALSKESIFRLAKKYDMELPVKNNIPKELLVLKDEKDMMEYTMKLTKFNKENNLYMNNIKEDFEGIKTK